jgi:hypothetical protein
VSVVVDYGKQVEMDAVSTWGARSPSYNFYILTENVDPEHAREEQWELITRSKPGNSKIAGESNNRQRPRQRILDLPETKQVRAMRFEYTGGVFRGKDGVRWLKAAPQRINCDHIQAIRLADETRRLDPRGQPAIYTVMSSKDGKVLRQDLTYGGNFKHLAPGRDGDFWAIRGEQVFRTKLQGDEWHSTEVTSPHFGDRLQGIYNCGDDIAVCQRGPVVLFDAASGQENGLLGGAGTYQRGRWHPDMLDRPRAISKDRNGEFWLVESSWYPKRVARYTRDGKCVWNVNGAPEYGGGGFIHPDFDRFHYRGMQFDINYSDGTSHMDAINDRPYTEETTMPERSFTYTRGGRVIQHAGFDYAVHEAASISVLENDVWRPAIAFGWANKSTFLTAPEKAWSRHWRSKNLQGKYFFWTDVNEDGKYQVNEVQLLSKPIYSGSYFTQTHIADDLTIWSSVGRLAPRGVSSRGVPQYDLADFQPWDGTNGLPMFLGLAECGSRACPWPNKFTGPSVVDSKGRLAYLHSPYLFNPDLTTFGGVPNTTGGGDGYRPEVLGQKVHHATGYSGRASADGAVDEIHAITGNLGRLTIVAGQDRLVLDQLFTGSSGDIASLPAERGIEATGYKLFSENFFSHFLRVNDGRHFFQSGQNNHALFRIEGLNDIQVQKNQFAISNEDYRKNLLVRAELVREWRIRQEAMKRQRNLIVRDPQYRLRVKESDVVVDGWIDEWGTFEQMQAIDQSYLLSDPEPRMFVDGVATKRGLVLAYCGFNYTENGAASPREIFNAGFAFDLRFRSASVPKEDKKSKRIVAGDKRIVFGEVNGEWTAVQFDYIDRETPGVSNEVFASPVVETRIDSMEVLDPEKVIIAVKKDALWADMADGGKGQDSVDSFRELLSGSGASTRQDYPFWTAEVLIPWKILGFSGQPRHGQLRADVGVIGGKSDGSDVGERRHWASPQVPQTVSDIGAEAAIDPRTWGVFSFGVDEDDLKPLKMNR